MSYSFLTASLICACRDLSAWITKNTCADPHLVLAGTAVNHEDNGGLVLDLLHGRLYKNRSSVDVLRDEMRMESRMKTKRRFDQHLCEKSLQRTSGERVLDDGVGIERGGAHEGLAGVLGLAGKTQSVRAVRCVVSMHTAQRRD